jgi:rhamnosyltransferase
MFKIIGIVTSYYPNLIDLEKNITSYLAWIDRLIIWENTPKEDSNIERLITQLNNDKIEVRSTGVNEYLANPFNQCIIWAQKEGYTHLLTMDQDSCFAPNHFEQYIESIKHNQNSNVAVFGPSIHFNANSSDRFEEVSHVIISGAVFPIDSLSVVGFFNEDLVIDVIDMEYCFRARKKGYKVIRINSVYLEHSLGYRHKHWTGITLSPYSAQRTYYYIRNTLWLWKQFPCNYEKRERQSFIRYKIIYRTLKIGFEPDAFRKLLALYTAIWHVYKERLGKYDKFIKRK